MTDAVIVEIGQAVVFEVPASGTPVVILEAPFASGGPGGGGGAVDSVNSQTGAVVLDAGDIVFTPVGTIAATDVQAAIAEVASEAGTGSVSDTAYDATTWDGVTTVAPSKNAVRDEVETIVANVATNTTAIATETTNRTNADALKAPLASPTFTGVATSPVWVASGLTGAVAASRYAGATTSGAPVAGTFAVGDFVIAQNGHVWICTTAGSPGTWTDATAGGGGLSTTLTSAHLYVGNGSNVATDTAITGDVTITNAGVTALATSGVTAATYGDATHVLQATFDAKGRATSATAVAITGLAESAVTGLVTDLAAKAPLASPTFTGTVTIPSGSALATPTSITLTNATGLPVSTGLSGLATGMATFLAGGTSAQLAAALTDETGSGAAVFATSPVLVTPSLGTPSALVLTNATGLPIGSVTGLGTGVGTFLATPSSANLAAALTDETGTGAAVFATSPTLVTPALGTPSALVLTNATGLPVAGGGTGVATLTPHGVVIGNGTGAVVVTGAGTANQVLTSNGGSADPTFQDAPGAAAVVKVLSRQLFK